MSDIAVKKSRGLDRAVDVRTLGGEKPPQMPAGRTCVYCPTKLSIYNTRRCCVFCARRIGDVISHTTPFARHQAET